jgi:DUF3037 family protein
MASHYTVVQFVPDPIIDERINIGVIAFGGHDVHARFVSDWNRVRRFGGQDVGFLRDFASQVARQQGRQMMLINQDGPALDENKLKAMAGRWVNCVQFTAPRASLKAPEELVEEMSERFLRSAVLRRPRVHRTKRDAVAMSFQEMEDALIAKVGIRGTKLMQRTLSLDGLVDRHEFDVGVANGKPLLALNALSFEARDDKKLQTEVDAVAWAIDDVRKVHRTLPIGVLLLPPKGRSGAYDRAKRTFSALRADALSDDTLAAWSVKQAKRIATHVPKNVVPRHRRAKTARAVRA